MSCSEPQIWFYGLSFSKSFFFFTQSSFGISGFPACITVTLKSLLFGNTIQAKVFGLFEMLKRAQQLSSSSQHKACKTWHAQKHILRSILQTFKSYLLIASTFFDFWMIICLVLIIFQYPLDLTYCWIKISIPFTNNHATGIYNDTNFLCLWNLYSNINKQSIKSWSYRLLHEGFVHNAVNYLHTFIVKQSR